MPTPRRPLAVTADPELTDHLLRLAAAAHVELDLVDDPQRATGAWTAPPLILVGADLAAALARHGPPRRDGVVLVGQHDDGEVWRLALIVGASSVALGGDAESWLVDMLAEAAEPVTDPALTIAVAGGRGGAGASVLAAGLAVRAHRRGPGALLIDADPLGGGIDMLLGQEDAQGTRWDGFARRHGRLSPAALRAALPHVDGMPVLTFARGSTEEVTPEAMAAVVRAAGRGGGVVVLDLPRALDPAGAEALRQCDVCLLVVPAEVRATVAAARVQEMLLPYARDVRVVVRAPAPGGLTAAAVARSLDLPLAGELAVESGLDAALDAGRFPPMRHRAHGPLTRFCDRLLDRLLDQVAPWVPGRSPERAAA